VGARLFAGIDEVRGRVFLEPEAASRLDDGSLDTSVERNQISFTIADEIPPPKLLQRVSNRHGGTSEGQL
jgi:hypothetical protein